MENQPKPIVDDIRPLVMERLSKVSPDIAITELGILHGMVCVWYMDVAVNNSDIHPKMMINRCLHNLKKDVQQAKEQVEGALKE